MRDAGIIAFLTNDLVFPSRVKAVAERLGARMVTAATVDSLAAKLEGEAVVIVIADLSMPGADPAAMVPHLKALPQPPRAIIAYGPHVHEAKLAAASAAGCDMVMSRGQFNAQMDAILSEALRS